MAQAEQAVLSANGVPLKCQFVFDTRDSKGRPVLCMAEPVDIPKRLFLLCPVIRLLRRTLRVQAQSLRCPDGGAHHDPRTIRLSDILENSSDNEQGMDSVD